MQNGAIYETWVYHQRLSPAGKIIRSDELADYRRRGWVDTPSKYGRGPRGIFYSAISYLETWNRTELMTLAALAIAAAALLI